MMFGGLGMLLFWGLIIVVLVLLVRALSGRSSDSGESGATPPRPTPLEILRERYARGEIDKAEFEERRKTLGV
jgi:putative membrane protein